MKIQNIFSDITIKKTAEKFEIEAYPEDMKEIERYMSYKTQALGGEVKIEEVLNKMVRSLHFDTDYVANVAPEFAKPKTAKKEKPIKRDTEAPVA